MGVPHTQGVGHGGRLGGGRKWEGARAGGRGSTGGSHRPTDNPTTDPQRRRPTRVPRPIGRPAERRANHGRPLGRASDMDSAADHPTTQRVRPTGGLTTRSADRRIACRTAPPTLARPAALPHTALRAPLSPRNACAWHRPNGATVPGPASVCLFEQRVSPPYVSPRGDDAAPPIRLSCTESGQMTGPSPASGSDGGNPGLLQGVFCPTSGTRRVLGARLGATMRPGCAKGRLARCSRARSSNQRPPSVARGGDQDGARGGARGGAARRPSVARGAAQASPKAAPKAAPRGVARDASSRETAPAPARGWRSRSRSLWVWARSPSGPSSPVAAQPTSQAARRQKELMNRPPVACNKPPRGRPPSRHPTG